MKKFEQIVPLWSKKLKRGFDKAREPCIVNGKELDISKYRTCIVGEAYKFSKGTIGYSAYDAASEKKYCNECTRFANSFDFALNNLGYTETQKDESKEAIAKFKYFKREFGKLKREFVKHWNEVHEDKNN